MIPAQLPANEAARLSDLQAYSIMDSGSDKDFDDIVSLASTICGTPISLVTLLDEHRQWFKARYGLEAPETARDISFCSHAILQDTIMIVPDALEDERFHDNPMVTGDPNVRFYAGMPLITPRGSKMGTLCVIDRQPRQLTEAQRYSLEVLARQVVKQMELHKTNRELKRLNEVDKKLLSIIAHDLRSPFSSIYNALDIVEQYDLSPEQFKEMVPPMRQTVNSGLDLISNLVEWAVTQFEGKANTLVNFALRPMADEIFAASQQLFDSKKNVVANNIDEHHLVHADKKKIEFVIRNLLLNANKFTGGGHITLSSQLQDGFVQVSITDTGKGVPHDILDAIFSWDKKTSTEGTQGEKGSGLGLPLCKELIEGNGGKIWVESRASKNTVFNFTLPVSK